MKKVYKYWIDIIIALTCTYALYGCGATSINGSADWSTGKPVIDVSVRSINPDSTNHEMSTPD
jgi:hypothetical protein